MPVPTTFGGLYDPAQSFNINLVPVVSSASALSGAANTICTVTTTTNHGFAAVLAAFQKVPSYNVLTGQGPQLGVIIGAGAGPTILNSTWIVASAPSANTFTFALTPAQAVQAAGTLVAATITPFMTLPAGIWDYILANGDIMQWASAQPPLPPGPVGGANTTVAGVVGGSILPFGALGNPVGVPIGGGSYTQWNLGVAVANGDEVSTDGISWFLQFGPVSAVTTVRKRAGAP
jgi:hypothetical protein